MSAYAFARKCLFQLDPEKAHHLTLNLLAKCYRPSMARHYLRRLPDHPVSKCGLTFKNPVGIAPGFDNNGDYINGLLGLGFGFIELGGVTPKPQPGNPKPRLRRLIGANALLNRMGFPNKGIEYLAERLQQPRLPGVIGVNIGKNKATPLDNALDDYSYCLKVIFEYADYVTINLSTPNTPGIRDLQSEQYLQHLLSGLAQLRDNLAAQHHKQLPLFVKLSIDTDESALPHIVDVVHQNNIDGLITSNTTVRRDLVAGQPHIDEAGGVSGQPIFEPSTQMLSRMHELAPQLALIGLGGIFSASDAKAKFKAGADLVQIYSGLVYRGPGLVKEILRNL